MATPNTDAIASSFLKALGAPNTPVMRKAVQAWLVKEGISSVKRNNPWNLHGGAACKAASHYCPGGVNIPGAIGRAYAGPGDQNVVVFSTLDAGVRANAQNLLRHESDGKYGYDKVIKYARAGDAVNFLNALALSSWSEGRYGTRGNGSNSLIVIFNQLTGQHADPFSWKAIGKSASAPPSSEGKGGIPSAPVGGRDVTLPFGSIIRNFHLNSPIVTDGVITAWGVTVADTPALVHLITGDNRLLTGDAWNAYRDQVTAAAASYKGKPVSALPDTITVHLTDAALTPSTAQGPQEALLGFLGKLVDPGTWARILALGLGGFLVVYGGIKLASAGGEPNTITENGVTRRVP